LDVLSRRIFGSNSLAAFGGKVEGLRGARRGEGGGAVGEGEANPVDSQQKKKSTRRWKRAL